MNKYTREFIDFVAKHKTMKNTDLLELLKVRFPSYEMSVTKLKNLRTLYKLQSGVKYNLFAKGHVPANKGQKMPEATKEKVKETWFKKGHIPHNTREIGSELEEDGRILVKVKDTGKRYEMWRPKQLVIWEQYHNEKVPKGSFVTFLDGDKRNFDIKNLALITQSENVRMNQNGYRFSDAEITKAALNVVRLKIKIKEKEAERIKSLKEKNNG